MSIGNRRSRARRRGTSVATLGTAVLVGGLLFGSSPGNADPVAPDSHPTIQQVQRQLNQLNNEAERATQQYDTIRVRMQRAKAGLGALRADVQRQRRKVDTIRSVVVGSAVSQYQSAGGLSSAASLLVADNPSAFMNDLATNTVVQNQQVGLLTQLVQGQHQLNAQQAQAAAALSAITHDRQQLAARKAEIEHKLAAQRKLLDNLKAQQRARLLAMQAAAAAGWHGQGAPLRASRGSIRPPAHVDATGRAKIAVQTALAQLGKPYQWGAAGPDSFDCSGLMMYAWAAAGVSIPHSSWMQYAAGTPISFSQLRPGDLVFFYSIYQHVGMYLGNGMIIHAPHTGTVVQIVPMSMMPAVAAVRIG
ncbi:MAG TPA: NlpC/P60 family protein [Nocardioidaceae bacterium]|nr:NlpC/P60 family protein [Nocardioidaceae bacterium]